MRGVWRRKTRLGGGKVPNNPLISRDVPVSGNTFSPGAKLTALNPARKNAERMRVSQNFVFPTGRTAPWRISEPRKPGEGAFHVILLFRGEDPKCPRFAGGWGKRRGGTRTGVVAENGQRERWSLPSHPHPPGESGAFYQPETATPCLTDTFEDAGRRVPISTDGGAPKMLSKENLPCFCIFSSSLAGVSCIPSQVSLLFLL